MQPADRIHHIVYSYGVIETVLDNGYCIAYFEGYEKRDIEASYQLMEELYGRSFARLPNQGLQLVSASEFHNITRAGH